MGCRSCGAGWFSAILAALGPERSTSLIQPPGLDHCLPVAAIKSLLGHGADACSSAELAMSGCVCWRGIGAAGGLAGAGPANPWNHGRVGR